MVSIRHVAERAGVSVATVSNAINRPDRVSPATRTKVRAAVDELGYVRSESARQLRAGSSRLVALLVLDIGNPFFVDVARGVEDAVREQDLGVMLCNSDQNAEAESLYLSLFAEQRVRGALITPTDAGNVDAFRRHGIPHVLVDRTLDRAEGCSVSVDDVAGGEMAVRHLVEAGHTRIAYVSGPAELAQCRDRRTGAERALAAAGLPADELAVVEAPALDAEAGRDAGARLLGHPGRPTAVFCANDLMALGVLQSVFGAGLRIPDDVALVGYDDIEFGAAAAVPLTSVRQPAFQIGRSAAQLLLKETADEEHEHQRIVYEPELVVRRSSLAGR